MKKNTDKTILFASPGAPESMPAAVFSPMQITVGPGYPTNYCGEGRLQTLNTPRIFDALRLYRALESKQCPDLFIAQVDSFFNCVPINVAALPCPKVLLVADTHHGMSPIFHLLDYASRERYDRIALMHDPHHLHWFCEAGFFPVSIHVNVNVIDHGLPFSEIRDAHIAFVGQAGALHPRRKRLLELLHREGFPLKAGQGQNRVAAQIYSRAQVVFNCSLNGDINMRVFEVLSAGGCLLTDRLSAQTGLSEIFRDGEDLVLFDDEADLVNKARWLLSNPAECLRIARNGQTRYLSEFSSDQRRADFLEFALASMPSETKFANVIRQIDLRCNKSSSLETIRRRGYVYDLLQELHRQEFVDTVWVSPLSSEAKDIMDDLQDLVELKVWRSEPVETNRKICLIAPCSASGFFENAIYNFGTQVVALLVVDAQNLADPTISQLRTIGFGISSEKCSLGTVLLTRVLA